MVWSCCGTGLGPVSFTVGGWFRFVLEFEVPAVAGRNARVHDLARGLTLPTRTIVQVGKVAVELLNGAL